MPLNIALVCMPFASIRLPSIGLTQLKAVTERAGNRRVSLHYLNHEFGRLFGPELYDFICQSTPAHVSGIGEWLFRKSAFPDVPDNSEAYHERYAQHFAGLSFDYLPLLLEQRGRLDEFLDALIVRYRLHEADVVGMTSMFCQNIASIALAQRLRRRNPDQILVMGGANCESTMGAELVSNVPSIDFVFSGCALISFPTFIAHIENGDKQGCHTIDGVFSRQNTRSASAIVGNSDDFDWSIFRPEMQITGIKPLGQELPINTPIELDYDGFLDSLAQLVPSELSSAGIQFETSRGCWWGARAHCTFCGLNGGTMAYRAMRPELAVELINGLFDRYAARVSTFDAVDNILPKEYFESVISKIRPPSHVSLFYEVKADLTEEQVRILSAGRVMRIQPGIEALATSTLKLMHKGTTAFHGIDLLKHCKKYDVTPYWNLLIGFPGETAKIYETYAKILPTLFHLPPPSGVFPVRFDRFSPYFTSARQYGLKLAPYDYYALCYPFPAASLQNMAYYFQDTNYEAEYILDAAIWIKRLEGLTGSWQKSWSRPNGPPQLGLLAEKARNAVYDSRGTASAHYDLNVSHSAVLKAIGQPIREDSLTKDGEPASLDWLKSKKLTFSERGKVVSLVSPDRSGP